MSELSSQFIQQKYSIDREMMVGPMSYRIWMSKNNRNFMIDFTTTRSLLLSVGDYSGWKNALMDAREICTQFMKAEPICRYDAKPSQWVHFMEWELKYPREKLRKIVNHGDHLAEIPMRDLRLYGDYCITDFEDKALKQAYQDAAALHRKYPGVYGKDPGDCDAVRVLQANEFELFLEYTLLENSRIVQSNYRNTSRPIDDLKSLMLLGRTIDGLQDHSMMLALDYVAATICKNVGIKILKEPSDKYRLRFDENTFIKWFNYNSAHFTKICPDDASMAKVLESYQRGEDISVYAPQGDWRNA